MANGRFVPPPFAPKHPQSRWIPRAHALANPRVNTVNNPAPRIAGRPRFPPRPTTESPLTPPSARPRVTGVLKPFTPRGVAVSVPGGCQ